MLSWVLSLTLGLLVFSVTTLLWLTPRHPRGFNPTQPNLRHGLYSRTSPRGDQGHPLALSPTSCHLPSALSLLLSLSKFIELKQITQSRLALPSTGCLGLVIWNLKTWRLHAAPRSAFGLGFAVLLFTRQLTDLSSVQSNSTSSSEWRSTWSESASQLVGSQG